MSQDEGQKKIGEIISKCWKDTAFKQRFLTDPKAVLAEHDVKVPEGTNVKVVENTDTDLYIALPPSPHAKGELSDDQLDAVAGGAGVFARAPHLRRIVTTNCTTSGCTCYKDCIPW